MPLTLVVLAAGLSRRYGRMKQLDAVGPGGVALIDYAIYDARLAGFSKFVFVIRRELEPAFREHVDRIFEDSLTVSYAYQELDSPPLPQDYSLPPQRTAPWGTGHAILAAAAEVDGPFAVINADDFYGASAYGLLADNLASIAGGSDRVFLLMGYRLSQTLSPFGGVSRAICKSDGEGYLREIAEIRDIREEKGRISGVTETGGSVSLEGDQLISTNLWGFTPALFPFLHDGFAQFLAERGAEPGAGAEFLIGTALSGAIAGGEVRVRVIPADSTWLGITHPEDRARVAARLAELVQEGAYPEDASGWFQAR